MRFGPVHHSLTRRQTLGAAGLVGAAFALGRGPFRLGERLSGVEPEPAAAASCLLTPAKTEGPFFVDEMLRRSDVRSNLDGSNTRPGFPLALTITVLRTDDDCAPAEGAVIDIWHCDASGSYSDVAQNGTSGQTFLRGYQVADADGQVTFQTIYPGWYSGRAVHIHFKVRTFEDDQATYEFTSQLFFDPTLNATLQADATYDGPGTTTNDQDSIYGGDSKMVVPLSGSQGSGYEGAITVGLAGLPAGGSVDEADGSDGSVDAHLRRTRFVRRDGHRALTLGLSVDETVHARARLVRGLKVLGRRTDQLKPGRSALRLRVDRRAAAGPATLRLELTDRAGNRKTIRRTLRVPR